MTAGGVNADLTVKADGTQIFFTELLGADKELGDLGHFSYVFSSPVTTLQFIDLNDALMGMDNLSVTRVPWPSPLLLLGAGLAAWRLRRPRGLISK